MAVINATKKTMLDNLLALGTLKCAVLSTSHTTDIDTQVFFDDVSANEVSGTNYTAGGATMTSITTVVDTANDVVNLDFADFVFSNITVANMRFICFYVDTGVASTSPILNIEDLGADTSRTAQDLSFTVNASGMITF